MRIAVVGGRLQGVEVIYLARKAGIETVLIDRDTEAPARGLCHQFFEFDFTLNSGYPSNIGEIDLIFPAMEDEKVIRVLERWSHILEVPLAFDLESFLCSQSKLQSNLLFEKLSLPLPKTWPDCSFPVVVKPDRESGSIGVKIVDNHHTLVSILEEHQDKMVVQEFVEGPSFSIEVIGTPDSYSTLQITELFMDKSYDCKMVSTPVHLPEDLEKRLHSMAFDLAQALELKGIMDLEVILNQGDLKILEIDARFPSQTPMTVYWSTGINMVKILTDLYLRKSGDHQAGKVEYSTIMHIDVDENKIETCGEHIMANNGQLTQITGFFDATEAITTFRKNKSRWVATLIFCARSKDELEQKRQHCIQRISEYTGSTFLQ